MTAPGPGARRSWVPVPPESDFPLENLPYGAMRRDGAIHLCVAIGDSALDLAVLAAHGLLDGVCPDARTVFAAPVLNPLLRTGAPAWRATRARITDLLRDGDVRVRDAGIADAALVARADATFALAVDVGDYVDCYSSLEHATNLGKILRPGGEPLLPNWRYVPIGYHGRTATLVPSGTAVTRPRGQVRAAERPPNFMPTRALDFELELAFVTGEGPEPPASIAADHARETIFGVVLMNDWSARDIQAWEYQPLGPFLGKSFATSLGTWIVGLEALEPYRVRGPVQEPAPLAYLATTESEGYDIALEVALRSTRMREGDVPAAVVSRTNFKAMYWSMAQQLAHASSNGARVRAGDLFGSGTISGDTRAAYGSMIELTWRGAQPLSLPDGTERAFLEDGDEVRMSGVAALPGLPRIGLGECRGVVLPAPESAEP